MSYKTILVEHRIPDYEFCEVEAKFGSQCQFLKTLKPLPNRTEEFLRFCNLFMCELELSPDFKPEFGVALKCKECLNSGKTEDSHRTNLQNESSAPIAGNKNRIVLVPINAVNRCKDPNLEYCNQCPLVDETKGRGSCSAFDFADLERSKQKGFIRLEQCLQSSKGSGPESIIVDIEIIAVPIDCEQEHCGDCHQNRSLYPKADASTDEWVNTNGCGMYLMKKRRFDPKARDWRRCKECLDGEIRSAKPKKKGRVSSGKNKD
jgi:hypothetical protein